MAAPVIFEHVSLGLMGPVPHTTTEAMSIHCVIVYLGERVILLDTGFGTREMADPNRLLGFDSLFKLGIVSDLRMTATHRLQARGIHPDQVTDIVLTHMDNDHAGGLHDFPNATVHVSAEELDSYESIQPRGPYKPYQISHLTRFETYASTGETWFGLEARSLPLPADLEAKLIPLFGHTLGHCGIAYKEDGKWALHAGDAYFDARVNFLEQAPALPIEAAFQASSTQRQDSLRKLRALKEEHGDEVDVFCTHDEREFLDRTGGRGAPDEVVDRLLLQPRA